MRRRRHIETIEDLLDRVVVCPSGCWIWTGGDSGTDRDAPGSNYGRTHKPGSRTAEAAHRYVYKKFKGPIPTDRPQLDHICASWSPDAWLNRRCVNPDHLEPVNQPVNIARMYATRAMTQTLPLIPPAPKPMQSPLLAPGEDEATLYGDFL